MIIHLPFNFVKSNDKRRFLENVQRWLVKGCRQSDSSFDDETSIRWIFVASHKSGCWDMHRRPLTSGDFWRLSSLFVAHFSIEPDDRAFGRETGAESTLNEVSTANEAVLRQWTWRSGEYGRVDGRDHSSAHRVADCQHFRRPYQSN